ncbi:MOSC domain-containing protein [Falsirhodobacter halotolerans]|uniref:MOSC domain-containing protein n=1 Tax=Falsirhodobacter halotolerans TaxID=1146892 RepID=UPI001FD5AF5B|nr:MOSC domain-containing protein [Falsirhodobacter halotolerans]MCJ8138466.1 MOSC domain-containing protein [Falsirhodobacter halotolerans]
MIPRADLDAALPHILDAPKDAAPVTCLCFRPDYGQRTFPDRLTLTRAGGIPGERWTKAPWMRLADGSPDPRIQVSILPARIRDLVCGGGLHPGDPVIADLDMTEANLPVGTLLHLGTAVVRVSDAFNDACVKWKVRYGADAKDWVVAHPHLRLRGILCSIEQDGEVRLGDVIRKV